MGYLCSSCCHLLAGCDPEHLSSSFRMRDSHWYRGHLSLYRCLSAHLPVLFGNHSDRRNFMSWNVWHEVNSGLDLRCHIPPSWATAESPLPHRHQCTQNPVLQGAASLSVLLIILGCAQWRASSLPETLEGQSCKERAAMLCIALWLKMEPVQEALLRPPKPRSTETDPLPTQPPHLAALLAAL
jgi:hypothetical protein